MLRFGTEPFLECSSQGDRRFSAFHAKIKFYDSRMQNHFTDSIENAYQGAKIFEGGRSDLSWIEAKGKKPINVKEVREFYSHLWDTYFKQNPELLEVIKPYKGFSDIFGREGHACQAEEVYRIWNASRTA